jgi:outer membrane protein assembly factor BamB
VRHRFLAVDNGKNRLLYVDEHDPAKSWAVGIPPGSRDLQRLDQGRVLVSHGNGAAEYDLATGRKLAWAVERYSQVNGAQRLASGNTLLGANSSAGIVLYEVDREGKEVAQTLLPKLKDLRLLRRLDNGNILLTVSDPCRVIEVGPQGKIVWQAALPGKGYKAIRLANGNTLVSTGGEATVIELNPAGQAVRTVGGKKDHPALGLDWSSGFDLLPDGNILMANWLGHGKQGTGAHLVEFDRNNRVVWKWDNHQQAATITNVLVLDSMPAAATAPAETARAAAPLPEIPDQEIAAAYERAAVQNVLAAVNPKVFFGYWSVCAE